MTSPQRLLHAMSDSRARCGYDQPCPTFMAEASSGQENSRSDARHPRMRDQGRRDSIVSIGRRRSTLPGARPGDADSP